jgi:hypothetical protein
MQDTSYGRVLFLATPCTSYIYYLFIKECFPFNFSYLKQTAVSDLFPIIAIFNQTADYLDTSWYSPMTKNCFHHIKMFSAIFETSFVGQK